MEEEKINNLIIYLRSLYEKGISFNSIIENNKSFGIENNQYNINIEKQTSNVVINIIKELNIKKIKYSYKIFKTYTKINIIFNLKNYSSNIAKVNVPIVLENYLKIVVIFTKYIIENKINCYIKLENKYNNELFNIYFYDYHDAEAFINFYSVNEEYILEKKREILPLIYNSNGFGVSTEIKPYYYNNIINEYLCIYFSNISRSNKINSESLKDFFDLSYKKEKRILKKEILLFIIKSINCIENEKYIFEIFKYQNNMNIGSFDSMDYNLKVDNNKLIYFENKDKTIQIKFGSDDYLNICYSKFYNNVISKDRNETYYSYFKNIFIKILENKYNNIEKILNFDDLNGDIIYQQLILVSACFFAYKVMNFNYEIIYDILKKSLERKLNFKIKIDFDEQKVEKETFNFPFNIDYGNKVIKLKNNNLTTIYDYFRDNKVLSIIPEGSMLNLKNGTIVKSIDYLKEIYNIIPNYDSFSELVADNIELIEFSN